VEQYLEWFHSLGMNRDNLSLYEVPKGERAHYSKRTVDIMFRFQLGRVASAADKDSIILFLNTLTGEPLPDQ